MLANLFLHYAFDAWIAREFPHVQFERYCDDMVIHCASERQARMLRAKITERFRACGLELNREKTRTVYCKDSNRKGSYAGVPQLVGTLSGRGHRLPCKSGV